MSKLHLSSDLSLPGDAITQTFGILAVRGAGKTNTAAVMAEEMFRSKFPFVVVDPVGSWWGLRSSKDGKGPGLSIPIFGGRHGDVPLEKTAGQLLADLVVEERLSCVLDCSDFSEGDKTRFLIDFAERLYRRNEAPLHLFLEEADDYAPQRPFREQARLLRAWENVVRRGRARGLGITMITQRSAALNKNVLTQIETLIVLRTTSPQDRKAIEAWVEYHGQSHELLESLPELKAGEAWVWSPSWLKLLKRVQMRRRDTFDSAATPKQVAERRPATLADIDLGAVKKRMAATIEKAKTEDPRELRRRIVELERVNHLLTTAKPPVSSERIKLVEVPILKDRQLKRLEKLYARIFQEAERHGKAMSLLWNHQTEEAKALLGALQAVAGMPKPAATVIPISQRTGLIREQQTRGRVNRPTTIMVSGRADPGESLPPSRQRILNALMFLEAIGAAQGNKTQLALLSDARPTSGGYFNNLGALRSAGLITYPRPAFVALTDQGRARADASGTPSTTEELHDQIRRKLPSAKWRLLEILIEIYPKHMTKDELAIRAGLSPTSGGYFNNLGSLRSLGLIEYPISAHVAATSILFLESRA